MITTRVLAVDAAQSAAIAEAAAVIRAGGLVAFPTETVYGLGANALDAAAVAKIFAAKERPANDPLIVHVADADRIEQIVQDVPAVAKQLAARFWPGPLTLVLHRAAVVPDNVTAGGATVGIRVPDHPVAQALITAAGVPIAAPSANRFTRPSPTLAAHVLADLAGRIDVILDGGATSVGVESSVLDLTSTPPRLLRPGGIAREALLELLPDLVYAPAYLAEHAPAAAPGQLLKHYAPQVELRLYTGARAVVLDRLRADARALQAAKRRVGLLLTDADLADLAIALPSVALGTDATAFAQRLFAGLRALETTCDVILTRAPNQDGLGLAAWDRLFRATEGRVIQC